MITSTVPLVPLAIERRTSPTARRLVTPHHPSFLLRPTSLALFSARQVSMAYGCGRWPFVSGGAYGQQPRATSGGVAAIIGCPSTTSRSPTRPPGRTGQPGRIDRFDSSLTTKVRAGRHVADRTRTVSRNVGHAADVVVAEVGYCSVC